MYESKKLTARALIQYMNGNFNEYEKLINRAAELYENEPEEVAEIIPVINKCRYKINNQWIKATIDFSTGIIRDLNNNEIKKCNIRSVL